MKGVLVLIVVGWLVMVAVVVATLVIGTNLGKPVRLPEPRSATWIETACKTDGSLTLTLTVKARGYYADIAFPESFTARCAPYWIKGNPVPPYPKRRQPRREKWTGPYGQWERSR